MSALGRRAKGLQRSQYTRRTTAFTASETLIHDGLTASMVLAALLPRMKQRTDRTAAQTVPVKCIIYDILREADGAAKSKGDSGRDIWHEVP